MESIKEIKNCFQTACESELSDFIERYAEDDREGVKRIVASAQKKKEAFQKELERIEKLKKYEKAYGEYRYICGIDEVGRGPLAGPVVAGAVILPKDCDILYINDSKQLSEKKREELFEMISEKAVGCAVGVVDEKRIDEINILQATYEAMRKAIAALPVAPDILLNDAVTIPGVDIRQIPIIKGDAKSISIGAASIYAKVIRDRMMCELDLQYPEYHFAENKGYGSREHLEAIQKYGPCPIHRRSFLGKILAENSCAGNTYS